MSPIAPIEPYLLERTGELNPYGRKLTEWLTAFIASKDGIDASTISESAKHYGASMEAYVNEVVTGRTTAAAFFRQNPDAALTLWDWYFSTLPEGERVLLNNEIRTNGYMISESATRRPAYVRPALTKGGRLSEAGEILAKWLEQYHVDTHAGRAYRGVVAYAKVMPPAQFFREYKRESAELWEYYAACTVEYIQAEMEAIHKELQNL